MYLNNLDGDVLDCQMRLPPVPCNDRAVCVRERGNKNEDQ